jgi:tetratricopeptide (TPR) repeat protein
LGQAAAAVVSPDPHNVKAVEQPAVPVARSTAVDADTYYNIGIEALRKGDYPRAQQAFKQVLALNPDDPDASYNLGVLYDNYLINKKEALKYYLRYVNSASPSQDVETVRSWIKELEIQTKHE